MARRSGSKLETSLPTARATSPCNSAPAVPRAFRWSLFASGEARWLGVRINGGEEQPRVLLLSVPYALKAADAQLSADFPPRPSFWRRRQQRAARCRFHRRRQHSQPSRRHRHWHHRLPPTLDQRHRRARHFRSLSIGHRSHRQDRHQHQDSKSSTLDVKGGATVRWNLYLPVTGNASAARQELRTTQPGRLRLQQQHRVRRPSDLPSAGRTRRQRHRHRYRFAPLAHRFLAQTLRPKPGLNIASNGNITFAPSQIFPGTGSVTSVKSGLGLTGGPITQTGTLSIDTTVVPQLGVANVFNANQTVEGEYQRNRKHRHERKHQRWRVNRS